MKSRTKDNVCPHCMSKLLDNNGVMECTGSRLTVWVEDFKRYEKMKSNEKQKFLISFSDSERFTELFSRWSHVDSTGNRPNFTCGYTSQIFSSLPDNRVLMPDPMQVKRLETSLNRKLTEEEITGNTPVEIDGIEVALDMMVFPDDF